MIRAQTPPLAPTPSRPAQLAEWFAREIRAGRLVSGEKLPTEQELNSRFGVSRTVIREAMASLRSEGLVVSRQGSGVFVADHRASQSFRIVSDEARSLTEIENVLQLRLAVEVEAAAIAAEKRSDEDLAQMRRWLDSIDASISAGDAAIEADFAFHRSISAATGNPYFEKFMHSLGPASFRRDRSVLSRKPRSSAGFIWSKSRRSTGAFIRQSSGAMPRPRASLCANIWREAGSATAGRSTYNGNKVGYSNGFYWDRQANAITRGPVQVSRKPPQTKASLVLRHRV